MRFSAFTPQADSLLREVPNIGYVEGIVRRFVIAKNSIILHVFGSLGYFPVVYPISEETYLRKHFPLGTPAYCLGAYFQTEYKKGGESVWPEFYSEPEGLQGWHPKSYAGKSPASSFNELAKVMLTGKVTFIDGNIATIETYSQEGVESYQLQAPASIQKNFQKENPLRSLAKVMAIAQHQPNTKKDLPKITKYKIIKKSR